MEPKDLIHVTPYELWVRAEAWESKARSAEEEVAQLAARHDAELLAKPFTGIRGCGDHSCLIEKPEGLGTNGGCRCHNDRTKASIIVQRLAALRRQAEEEDDE